MTIFKLKRTHTAARQFTLAELSEGEIGINVPDKKIYMRNNSGSIVLLVDGSATGGGGNGWLDVVREVQVATAGQTVFNLSNSYVTGSNRLTVHINGVRQNPDAYAETSSTTVTMAAGLTAGDDVLFEIGQLLSEIPVASEIAYTPSTNVAQTDVQAAIAGLGTGKQATLVSGTNIKTVNGESILGSGNITIAGGGGTVMSVSVASANGFAGTVATNTTTPVITLTTSVTGLLKGNGTAISAALSGTDYAPGTSGLSTGILKTTTSTGALSIAVAGDFPTLNQNTTGTAANATNTAITDDTALGNIVYPTWVTATTGNLPQKVSSTKMTFLPSAGRLTVTSLEATNVFATSITSALNPSTGSTPGVSMTISPVSAVNGAGGVLTLNGGATTGTATAGNVAINGGAASGAGQIGGNVAIQGGTGAGQGGSVTVYGGTSSTASGGVGSVTVQGGAQLNASATQPPGNAQLVGGFTNQPGLTGGVAAVQGGQSANSSGIGGPVQINGGLGGASGTGGDVIIQTANTNSLIERLRIKRDGAWSIGTDGTSVGTAGQVITSGGSGVAPSWSSTPTLNLTNCTTDGTNLVGYRNVPQNIQSAAYTLVLTDAGKHLLHPSADTAARTFTIPANASVAFPIGTALTFVNQNGAGALSIAITTDTMRLAGAGTTGTRTLAANGIATALKITGTEWIISGTGLT